MLKKSSIFLLYSLAVGALLPSSFSYAAKRCPKNWALTTTYYTPDVQKICKSTKPCAKFIAEVRLQGSGTLTKNRILTYRGQTLSLDDCPTTRGAANTCLKPYISVAADPSNFKMGDIIFIESLKGHLIVDNSGKTFVHHGYFVVEDTGGAIKGPNRFDIYTGNLNYIVESENTSLLNWGVNDKAICSSRKAFKVLRRGTMAHTAAMKAIDDSFYGHPETTKSIAQENLSNNAASSGVK